jgi:hypothetical protein
VSEGVSEKQHHAKERVRKPQGGLDNKRAPTHRTGIRSHCTAKVYLLFCIRLRHTVIGLDRESVRRVTCGVLLARGATGSHT